LSALGTRHQRGGPTTAGAPNVASAPPANAPHEMGVADIGGPTACERKDNEPIYAEAKMYLRQRKFFLHGRPLPLCATRFDETASSAVHPFKIPRTVASWMFSARPICRGPCSGLSALYASTRNRCATRSSPLAMFRGMVSCMETFRDIPCTPVHPIAPHCIPPASSPHGETRLLIISGLCVKKFFFE